MVEKIKRDVRITTIYEGTSEIMEMTIARDRWQEHLKTRGQFYHTMAGTFEQIQAATPNLGAGVVALAMHSLAVVLERARIGHLTRNQHVLLRFGEIIAWVECAGSLARRAHRAATNKLNAKTDKRLNPDQLAAFSRVFAREAALKVASDGARLVIGGGDRAEVVAGLGEAMHLPDIYNAQTGLIADMDYVADFLCGDR